ncbi:MAG: hypothetical protein ACREJ6_14930, partial [Candidatus Methylomirabilis sp.]
MMNGVCVTTRSGKSRAFGLIAALFLWFLITPPAASPAAPAGDELWIDNGSASAAPAELLQFSDALSKLAERLRPAVVQVGLIENRDSDQEPPPGPPHIPDERPRIGSGFIIHPDGYLLT